jgi:hypothetical protein
MTKRHLLPFALLLAACEPEAPPMVGLAEARLATVPGDVHCVQIRVDGTQSVTRRFDVVPGQGSVLSLDHLPVGAVVFSASAFDATCAAMPAPLSWVSDPVATTLAGGTVVPVTLRLRRAGAADVTIDFDDADGGTAPPVDIAIPPPTDMSFPFDLSQPPPSDLGPSPFDFGSGPTDLAMCTNPCITNGWECGTASACGQSFSCGGCDPGYICQSHFCIWKGPGPAP